MCSSDLTLRRKLALHQLDLTDGPLSDSADTGLLDGVSNRFRPTRLCLDPSDRQVRLKIAVIGAVSEVARLRLYPSLEFLQLIHVTAYSDPNHPRFQRVRKTADVVQRELKLYLTFARWTERRLQLVQSTRRHVAEELEREVKLFGLAPTYEFSAHFGVELSLDLSQSFDQGWRDGDGDESADSFCCAGKVHTPVD